MVKKSGWRGGVSGGGNGKEEWKSALPEEQKKTATEKLVERKDEWMDWLVPSGGLVGVWRWGVHRVWSLSLWTMGVVQLGNWFGEIWVAWLVIWMLPIAGYGFVCWMQRNSCGVWIWVSLGLMVFGLVLSVPGFLALMGF